MDDLLQVGQCVQSIYKWHRVLDKKEDETVTKLVAKVVRPIIFGLVYSGGEGRGGSNMLHSKHERKKATGREYEDHTNVS